MGCRVLQMGEFAFGKPSRISARVRLGRGEVIDIEREIEMGGPLHSKGVLILSGFLGARFARSHPLALSASLVFEQSYGGVDGDSASSTELYALLSALSGVPIRQSLAVTGSVNQFGQVQAIGGVNEKIEGFFDICAARGLTGRQGVLIPAANVKHLMLRRDVVEAAAEGKFHVYPVETIDQGIELLTGVAAGSPDPEGNFPAGTVNGGAQETLRGVCPPRAGLRRGQRADPGGSLMRPAGFRFRGPPDRGWPSRVHPMPPAPSRRRPRWRRGSTPSWKGSTSRTSIWCAWPTFPWAGRSTSLPARDGISPTTRSKKTPGRKSRPRGKAVALAAARARVAHVFRTVRGQVDAEVLAAAGGGDLLILGTGNRVPWSRLRLGPRGPGPPPSAPPGRC